MFSDFALTVGGLVVCNVDLHNIGPWLPRCVMTGLAGAAKTDALAASSSAAVLIMAVPSIVTDQRK